MLNICDMINDGEIKFEEVLKMHPFSASSNLLYRRALEGIDFFSEFHIKTIETYERLSQISNLVTTSSKNLLIITGYKGCGKTNFLRFVEHVANGGKIDKTLQETRDFLLGFEKTEDGKKEIRERYDQAIEEIYDCINGAEENIEGTGLIDYFQKSIKGQVTYINFDIGGYKREKPLSAKLFSNAEERILDALEKKTLTKVIDIIDGFSKRNYNRILTNFEDEDTTKLDQLWRKVKQILVACMKDKGNTKELFLIIRKLSLGQLLFSYFIFELAFLVANAASVEDKQIYLLDNIDIISDTEGKTFRNTIFGIFSYIHNSKVLFSRIAEESGDKTDQAICSYYEKMNLIIAMRETSVMRVSDHNRKIVIQNMRSFDISEDVNKTLIIKMRVEWAKEKIQNGQIKNKLFIRKLNKLDSILGDELLMQRIILLNNNDVRTTDQLLSKLCEKNLLPRVYRYHGENFSSQRFGMRGIVFKGIFQIFDEHNYLRDLKIANYNDVRAKREYPYSFARIILALLYKQREKQVDRIIFNSAEYVDLKDLYDEVSGIVPLDEFVEILDRMYALRDVMFWNHLVTFDNVLKYSKEIIKNYIEKKQLHDEKKIYICITSAGQVFLHNICVHFEYFSQRFLGEKHKGLFDYNSFGNEADAEYAKNIIDTVFAAVAKCCKALEKYNLKVLDKLGEKHYSEIVTTPYYYESQFHEERIILNHIQYLNAYRRYMIDRNGNNIRLNQYLIKQIRKYLGLLYTEEKVHFRSGFITRRSESTFNKLSVCIEEIVNSDYKNLEIDITSDYYRKHYKGYKCRFIREPSMDYFREVYR